MPETSSNFAAVQRDRIVVWAGLVSLTALVWVYTIYLARHMEMIEMQQSYSTTSRSAISSD